MSSPAEKPVLHEIDGYLVDDNGEIQGIALPAKKFTVCDQSSCEWVMNKMLEAQAAISAVEHSPVVLHAQAVLENARVLHFQKSKKLEWLHRRFDAELGEFARVQLEGKKTKTFRTFFGSISRRIVRGKLMVKDQDAALAWAKECYPGAVKTKEEFQISKLSDEEEKRILDQVGEWYDIHSLSDDRETLLKAFEVKPDEEKVDVDVEVPK